MAESIATDLLAWLRLLCLDRSLASAEPETLRYRLMHSGARIVSGQRKCKIRVPESWPWSAQLAAGLLATFPTPPT